MLLLRNGFLTDPASGTEEYRDILIDTQNGKIRRIVPQGTSIDEICRDGGTERNTCHKDGEDGQVEEIDLNGQIVAPGLVDVHVHFRDPGFTYKEDIDTGAAAAAKGGFTSVVLMANTKPAVDNPETLSYVLRKGKETKIHVYTCANVTRGRTWKL